MPKSVERGQTVRNGIGFSVHVGAMNVRHTVGNICTTGTWIPYDFQFKFFTKKREVNGKENPIGIYGYSIHFLGAVLFRAISLCLALFLSVKLNSKLLVS